MKAMFAVLMMTTLVIGCSSNAEPENAATSSPISAPVAMDAQLAAHQALSKTSSEVEAQITCGSHPGGVVCCTDGTNTCCCNRRRQCICN